MSTQIGAYVRAVRSDASLTTRKLSASVDCSHAHITMIETGKRLPSLRLLWQIVDVAGGDFGHGLYLLCLDSGVPEEAVRDAISAAPDI